MKMMIHQWMNGATHHKSTQGAGRRRLAGLAVGRAKSSRLHGPTALAWHNSDINKGYNRGYIHDIL